MNDVHYIIIWTIVAVIVLFQLYSFFSNLKDINLFKKIFPKDRTSYQLEIDENTGEFRSIQTTHKGTIIQEIIQSVNGYLKSNSGTVCDYHLLKNIVDRNCYTKEEEISTQTPVPLYLGLMGTMSGILVGVVFLLRFTDGGLSALLNSTTTDAKGIEALLGGVGIAMIASIVGITLTTFASYLAKKSKKEEEQNKNILLSWIQENLLPNLSSDTSGALLKMTQNLKNFNSSFARNANKLEAILHEVHSSSADISESLQLIKSLDVKAVAESNIVVYRELKNCTTEIGQLATYLNNVNSYLENVRHLNEKLDQNEQRTQTIEQVATFFKEEIHLIEQRKLDIARMVETVDEKFQKAVEKLANGTQNCLIDLQDKAESKKADISRSIARADELLQKALDELKESTANQVQELRKTTGELTHTYEEAIMDQSDILKKKLQETGSLVDELKNLSSVKASMESLIGVTSEQNSKLDTLISTIKNMEHSGGSPTEVRIKQDPVVLTVPTKFKIMAWVVGIMIAVASISVFLRALNIIV